MKNVFRPSIMLIVILCINIIKAANHNDLVHSISFTKSVLSLKHIWNINGFDVRHLVADPSLRVMNIKDMSTTLGYISSVPFSSVTYIRCDNVFDLVRVRQNLTINFSKLDSLIKPMFEHGLTPLFVLSGTPRPINVFKLIPNKWKFLCSQIVKQYSASNANNKVWGFELWNTSELTNAEYMTYIKECLQGLKEAPITIWIGGPPMIKVPHSKTTTYQQKFHSYCKLHGMCNISFVTYYANAPPYYSNITGYFYQTMSTANVSTPIASNNREFTTSSSMMRKYKSYADVKYAALIVSSYLSLIQNPKYKDIDAFNMMNIFLNDHRYFFTRKNFLARFKSFNIPGVVYSQFIKKPSLMALMFLGYLGPLYVALKTPEENKGIGFIATLNWKYQSTRAGILCVNVETMNSSLTLNLEVPKHWIGGVFYVDMITNLGPHPYAVWKAMNEPSYPTSNQLIQMRNSEEPQELKHGNITSTNISIKLTFRESTLALINICSKDNTPPEKVNNFRALNITVNEVLLLWKDNNIKTRCLKTFAVEFKNKEENAVYRRINNIGNTKMCSFQYSIELAKEQHSIIGYYRVAAIDYWNRIGPYSNELYYS